MRHGRKDRSEKQAPRQSTLNGHSSKGLWVAKAIAGGGLFVPQSSRYKNKNRSEYAQKITITRLDKRATR